MTVAIVMLVMMSAYFSATETAFSCLNKIRMKSRAESGDHRAALAMDLVEDYDRLISTILIGNNIVNITASTVGTVLFTKLYAAYGPTVSTVVLTLVVLIFGEISPKSLAKEHAESFAMFSAPILRVFLLVLRPLNFLFSQWKRLLNMIFHPSEDQGITEEEQGCGHQRGVESRLYIAELSAGDDCDGLDDPLAGDHQHPGRHLDADAEAQHGAAHGQRQQPHGQHTDLHPGEESHAHINEQAEHHIHSNL